MPKVESCVVPADPKLSVPSGLHGLRRVLGVGALAALIAALLHAATAEGGPAITPAGIATASDLASPLAVAADPKLEADMMELRTSCAASSARTSRSPNQRAARGGPATRCAGTARRGQGQDDVIDYLVERYGDFVLYEPPFAAVTGSASGRNRSPCCWGRWLAGLAPAPAPQRDRRRGRVSATRPARAVRRRRRGRRPRIPHPRSPASDRLPRFRRPARGPARLLILPAVARLWPPQLAQMRQSAMVLDRAARAARRSRRQARRGPGSTPRPMRRAARELERRASGRPRWPPRRPTAPTAGRARRGRSPPASPSPRLPSAPTDDRRARRARPEERRGPAGLHAGAGHRDGGQPREAPRRQPRQRRGLGDAGAHLPGAEGLPRLPPPTNASTSCCPTTPTCFSDWADVVAAQTGRSGAMPRRWCCVRSLAEPKYPKALALAGTAAYQRDDFAAAAGYWERILALIPGRRRRARRAREHQRGAREGRHGAARHQRRQCRAAAGPCRSRSPAACRSRARSPWPGAEDAVFVFVRIRPAALAGGVVFPRAASHRISTSTARG